MKRLLSIIISIAVLSCNSNDHSNSDSRLTSHDSRLVTPTYQETKMTLEQKEKANPFGFLQVNYTYRKNLIGQWVLEGTVTNKATLATYKDLVLKISYYSKTKTLMNSEQQIIYDYFKPNSNQKFKLKTFGVQSADALEVALLDASAVN